MSMQSAIDFTTASPINVEKLSKQNKIVYDYLAAGNTITLFQAVKMGVLHLHSRISDLTNVHGITIYRRFITVPDMTGEHVQVKEYSLNPFEN